MNETINSLIRAQRSLAQKLGHEPTPKEIADRMSLPVADVRKLLKKAHTPRRILTPREEKILKMRFGIGGGAEHTQEEVRKTFTVTRERIRQIESKALERLRRPRVPPPRASAAAMDRRQYRFHSDPISSVDDTDPA